MGSVLMRTYHTAMVDMNKNFRSEYRESMLVMRRKVAKDTQKKRGGGDLGKSPHVLPNLQVNV